jgi:exodeoxyribonuclease VII large subunit
MPSSGSTTWPSGFACGHRSCSWTSRRSGSPPATPGWPSSPATRLRDAGRDLARLPQASLDAAILTALATLGRSLDGPAKLLESLSHRRVLERGYALVHGEQGFVTERARAAGEARLEIEFADGRLPVAPLASGAARRRPAARTPSATREQGSLL